MVEMGVQYDPRPRVYKTNQLWQHHHQEKYQWIN
jgi:hypothetical protein